MICPICKTSMSLGYIPTTAIEWVPENDSPKVVYKDDKSNGFRIGKHSFIDMKKQAAWYCSACDKLIIDCSEKK